MKRFRFIAFKAMMMTAMLTLVWACGSSDDDNEGDTSDNGLNKYTLVSMRQIPDWKIDWNYNDQKPSWTAPEAADYENWMIAMVTLQDELVPYSSDDDLMAVFIGDEIRAVNGPARVSFSGGTSTDKVRFILKILGNEAADKKVHLTVKYYCSKLNQIFTLEGSDTFSAEKVWGVDDDLVLPLLDGSSKYPLHTRLNVSLHSLLKYFTPSADDMVAVMVGDECRGVTTVGDGLLTLPVSFTVYGNKEHETGWLFYFNEESSEIWNLNTEVDLTGYTAEFTI